MTRTTDARPAQRRAVLHRARRPIVVVALVLSGIFVWREVAARRQARALFDATLPPKPTLAAEFTTEEHTLGRLRTAPKRVREVFFDAVFLRLIYEKSDRQGFSCMLADFESQMDGSAASFREWFSRPTYEERFLDDGILQAALGVDPEDRYELLGEVLVDHCFNSADPAFSFYNTCRSLLSQLARPPEAKDVVETVVDRIVEAMAVPKIQWAWAWSDLSGEQLLVDLSRELKALGDKLPAGAAEKAAERIADRALVALDPDPLDLEDFLTLLEALEILGEELDDHVTEALARRIVDSMAATRKSPQVTRLSRALGNLGRQLSAGVAEEVAEKLVSRILGTGDVAQLDFRTQALRTLGETLSAGAAERAAVAVVEGIAAARDENQRAFLSRASEAFGVERRPAEEAQRPSGPP